VGASIEHAQVERQHRHHKQVEKNPEDEHRESYDRRRVYCSLPRFLPFVPYAQVFQFLVEMDLVQGPVDLR
jgi:hypothetical protein